MYPQKPIILASNSPRRQQILTEAGISFTVQSKNVKEHYPSSFEKEQIPVYLATIKAAAFLPEITDEIVIGSDTIVYADGRVLEKPGDYKDACAMLEFLSGKMHEVITGVCMMDKSKSITFFETTEVYFDQLSKEDIAYYVENFRPYDKAGSYGIQEWIGLTGVYKINGSYFNVMGLPIHRLLKELKKF